MTTTKRQYSINRLVQDEKMTPTRKQIRRQLKDFYWHYVVRIKPPRRIKQNELNDDNN